MFDDTALVSVQNKLRWGRLKVEQSGGLCSSVKRYQKPELMKMRKGAVKEITETEYLDFKADQTEGRG